MLSYIYLFTYLLYVCVSLFPLNHLASHPLVFFDHFNVSFVSYNLFSPHFLEVLFLLLSRLNVQLRWHRE